MALMDVMRRYWRLGAFLCCMAMVLYGMFRPESPPEVFSHSDKWGHVLAFMALSVTGRLAFTALTGWAFWSMMLAVAPLLEGLQGALRPLRHFSLGDAAANVIGVLLALLLWALLRRVLLRYDAASA